MSDEYRTVTGIAYAHHVEKKSRFFAEATTAKTKVAVKSFLTEVQKRNPRASHYCYAYSISKQNARQEYATDAGEPTYSAGPPILAAILAFDLCNTVCVVARYYGCINLGVGGLIRAYGRCARECLENATIKTEVFYQNLCLEVNYSTIGTVITLCKRSGGKVVNIKYNPDPIIEVQIRQSALENFQSRLHRIGVITQ